jgi:hypothetical protein
MRYRPLGFGLRKQYPLAEAIDTVLSLNPALVAGLHQRWQFSAQRALYLEGASKGFPYAAIFLDPVGFKKLGGAGGGFSEVNRDIRQ